MKNLFLAALIVGNVTGGAALADDAETEAALTELADTFARGFYARDPEMVLSTVHPELSKIGVTENYWGTGIQIIEQLPPGTLQVLGSVYNYNHRLDPVTSTVGVNFFESTESMGLLRLTADQDWYDYFLGTHINGEWVFINCAYGGYSLIDNPNREADMALIDDVVSGYAGGWDAGEYAPVIAAMYPDADRRHVVRGGRREYLQPETLEMIEIELEERGVAEQASTVTVFEATQRTGAARIDAADRTEWVLLTKLNDRWQIVNSYWEPRLG